MKRRISSLQTFLMKFILPLIGVPFFIEMFLFWDSGRPFNLPIIFAVIPLFLVARHAHRDCSEFKKVSIDDQNLYVSNYLKEIVIPFSQIKRVTESKWLQRQMVEIQLRSETEFGDKILFMPTTETRLFFMTHPVVKELNQLAAERQKVLIK